ncbi:leucine-rich repeat flightless-interacting protein 2 isoform X3 [Nelusetta ayraudi]|uniref:leucine-rich repeat flightless-interacting protein 2 isoform X3 n=1 Tax=Nelusetta ayraudi TaxID=303726 RepID=UPI003F729585
MGSHGPGRRRTADRERLTAEDDALNQVVREAEARLAAKRAARAEARDIRMKELERQQRERCSPLDTQWSHIEQWMVSDDEEKMSVGSRGSFRPSDYSALLGSGSRASSRASSARASPVVEDRADRDLLDKGSRTASTLSAATLASLGGASSRRGSCDTSFSMETEASIRDMKEALLEAEERYRRAMVSNAQLHNNKSTLMYQVEALKDELSDLEELLWETRRHRDELDKECERERQKQRLLQLQLEEAQETLRHAEELMKEVSDLRLKSSTQCQEVSDLQEVLQWKDKKMAALEKHSEVSEIVWIDRDRLRVEVLRLLGLLKEHGVAAAPSLSISGETVSGQEDGATSSDPGLTEEASHHSRTHTLESRLQKLFEEREGLQDEVRLLRAQLAQRDTVDGVQHPEGGTLENGMQSHLLELQRDANRQSSELKFKLVKCEQEVTSMEQNVIRLEGQVTRYRLASEIAERTEDELKVEKRKLQRELRVALDRVVELEASNGHLTKRLEKMKANRSALLAQH